MKMTESSRGIANKDTYIQTYTGKNVLKTFTFFARLSDKFYKQVVYKAAIEWLPSILLFFPFI